MIRSSKPPPTETGTSILPRCRVDKYTPHTGSRGITCSVGCTVEDGVEEQVSLSSTVTDVNSFIFASGDNLYAIYYDTSTESLYYATRDSSGAWIQTFIGFGEARLAGSQYSL